MVLVRPQDLSYMAGGAVAARHGVFVRRTSPTEDVAETFTRSTTAPRFDENGIVRSAAVNVPRLSWKDTDRDGVYEEATLPIGPQTVNVVEFNVPGGTPADFETQELDGVTNLANEFGVQIDEGDDLRYLMGADWDPDSWTIEPWAIPNFDSTDGAAHNLIDIYKDASNYVRLFKSAGGALGARVRSGGTSYDVSLTLAFSAGAVICVGARLHAGTLTIYVDDDADNTLDTDAVSGIPSMAGGTWHAYAGQTGTLADRFEGAINLLITSNGRSADPITDRFNAGAGMAMAGDDGWMARHGEDLVLHVGANSDGSLIQADSFTGATDLLEGTATGRVDLDPTTDFVRFGNTAEFDAATKVSMMWEVEVDATGSTQPQFLSDSGGIAASSLAVTLEAGSQAWAYFAGGGNYERQAFGTAKVAGDRFLLGMAMDLGLATTARVKWYEASYDSVTRRYGVWTELTGSKTEAGSVPAFLATETGIHQIGGSTWDGKFDSFRWAIGQAHDFTSIKPTVNEANPAHWDHAYDFDVDADDRIGSVDGTVTGGSFVDDGRHNLGSFERWVKQGQYYFDGVNDRITHGDYSALDGAVEFAFEWVGTVPDTTTTDVIVERGRLGTDGGVTVRFISGGTLEFYLPSGAANTDRGNYSAFVTAGQTIRLRGEYNGGGAGNADRLKVYRSVFDPESGTWSALAEVTASSFSGTIPASLQTVATNVTLTVGSIVGGGDGFLGMMDRFGLHAGSRPASKTIYEDGSGLYDIWADYDGDADNAGLGGATYDGSVTGAVQVADGRQPEGWTISGSPEVDRTRWLARKTVSRDSPASYWDHERHLLRTAPAGHLRDRDWQLANDGNWYRVTRLEDERENGWTYSKDLSNGAWTKAATTIGSDVIHGPDGTVSADKLIGNSGLAEHRLDRAPPAMTDDTDQAVSFKVKADEFTWLTVDFVNKAGSTVGRAGINLTTGAFGTSSWSSAQIIYRKNGWYEVRLVENAGSGGGSPMVKFYLADSDVDLTTTGNGSDGLYLTDIQFEVDAPFSSSHIPTVASAVTREADSLVDEYTAVPQEATWLVSFVEGGTIDGISATTLLTVGNSAWAAPYLTIRTNGTYYQAVHDPAAASISTLAVAPVKGDLVEIRVTVSSAGVVQIHQSINGAAEVSATAGTAQAFGGAWSALELTVNGVGSYIGTTGISSIKNATGSNSLATMQALTEDDASVLYFYSPGQYTDEGMYGVRAKQLGGFLTLAITTPSVTDEDWLSIHGRGREIGATSSFRLASGAVPGNADAPLTGVDALTEVGYGIRATSTDTTQVFFIRQTNYAHAYIDDLRAYEYATVSPSTATKGDAFPMIDGLGGVVGIADASIVVASAESIPLPFDTNYGTKIVKLESGPAGSGTRRYRLGFPGTLNGFTADQLAGMVVGIYVPGTSEITPAQVTTHAVDDQGSSAGDAATANDRWEWLWATRIWDASALEAYFEVRFADGVSLSGADEVVYMAVPTAVADGVPLVPIPQATEGTSTVEEEEFYSAFDIPPGAGGLYIEARVWAPGTLIYLGNDPTSGARLSLKVNADLTVGIVYTDGTTTRTKDSVGTVAAGEILKALGTITAEGVIQLSIKVEDGAKESSSAATALALPDDWADQLAYLGSKGASDWATLEVLDAKVVRAATYTLEEVAAVT